MKLSTMMMSQPSSNLRSSKEIKWIFQQFNHTYFHEYQISDSLSMRIQTIGNPTCMVGHWNLKLNLLSSTSFVCSFSSCCCGGWLRVHHQKNWSSNVERGSQGPTQRTPCNVRFKWTESEMSRDRDFGERGNRIRGRKCRIRPFQRQFACHK